MTVLLVFNGWRVCPAVRVIDVSGSIGVCFVSASSSCEINILYSVLVGKCSRLSPYLVCLDI